MVSIKELRKICQAPEDRHNPTSLIEERIPRIFSIYITKLLIYTPLTADNVTMIMVFWGFIAGFLFSTGTYWYMLAGAVLLEFIPILDCVDGELARYRKTCSLRGVFLDPVAHLTNTVVIFMGLTIGLYKFNPCIYTVLIGLSACVFSALCLTVQPMKYYVIVKELIEYSDGNRLRRIGPKKADKKIAKEATKKNNLKSIGRMVNLLYHGFSIIHLLFFAAIFNKPYWALLFYGLTFPLIWLIKLIYEYRTGYERYECLFEPYKK